MVIKMIKLSSNPVIKKIWEKFGFNIFILMGVLGVILISLSELPKEKTDETAQAYSADEYRKNMEEDPDAQRAPLWFLLILQLSSLNMVMILLFGFGILQTYGKSFFTKEAFKISPQNRSLMISMIPLAFLYALILFVRVRLNMI